MNNILHSWLKIPIKTKKEHKITPSRICIKTLELFKREMISHKLPNRFNLTVLGVLKGFNQKQLEYFYYIFPYWIYLKFQNRVGLSPMKEKIKNLRLDLIKFAKNFNAFSVCEKWKVPCGIEDKCYSCDINKADEVALSTLKVCERNK